MGYSMCAMNYPEVFDTDDDGTVVVTRGFTESERDIVELTVDSCPMSALTIEEDATTRG